MQSNGGRDLENEQERGVLNPEGWYRAHGSVLMGSGQG